MMKTTSGRKNLLYKVVQNQTWASNTNNNSPFFWVKNIKQNLCKFLKKFKKNFDDAIMS